MTTPSETLKTKRAGHAIELTASAIKKGAETIVAVGGDGTINEVVNGFFEGGKLISKTAALGILPYGTGSDLQRTLHLPDGEAEAAAVIDAGKSRPIDLLKVRYTRPDGDTADRYSINMTSFGMGGIVASRVSRSRKLFGGKISFALATLHTATRFAGCLVTLSLDHTETIETFVTNVAVGNGRYHGGGMLACPRAEVDDALFDVTLIPFMKLPELVRNLPLLYNGEIYTHRRVRFLRGKNLEVKSPQPTFIEIDGESVGCLPAEIEIVPKAMRVLA